MLVHVFHGSQVAFFELTATLIPVFLLAGLVTERILPREDDSDQRTLLHVSLIPIFATLGLVAEFLSINAVATGNSAWFFRWFVAGFLIASMVLAIFILWWPWLRQFEEKDHRQTRCLRFWSCGIFAILAMLGWVNLATGVDNGSKVEGANTFEHRYERNEDAQAALRRQVQNLTVQALSVRAQIGSARVEGRPSSVVTRLIKERRGLKQLIEEVAGELAETSVKAERLHHELTG